jgi:hypothetical protein
MQTLTSWILDFCTFLARIEVCLQIGLWRPCVNMNSSGEYFHYQCYYDEKLGNGRSLRMRSMNLHSEVEELPFVSVESSPAL